MFGGIGDGWGVVQTTVLPMGRFAWDRQIDLPKNFNYKLTCIYTYTLWTMQWRVSSTKLQIPVCSLNATQEGMRISSKQRYVQ